MLLTLNVNGRKREIVISADEYLLDVLRKLGYLKLTETDFISYNHFRYDIVLLRPER